LTKKHIAIIGAGASGLLSSIILGRAGFDVSVFEKNGKVGRKILATGNGRCNISNQNISLDNFCSTYKEFVNYSLKQFSYQDFKHFFEKLGLELVVNEKNRVYPMTLQASSVVDILAFEASRVGVKFILNTDIEKVEFNQNNFYLSYQDTQKKFDKLIIASGSKAMPKLGSSDAGYSFAKSFGHNIIKPFASLVQLKSDDAKIKNLNGLKINAKVELMINKEYVKSSYGDVLFTNYGVSGNAILDISRDASYALELDNLVLLQIDIFPNFSKDVLISKLTKRLKNSTNKDKYFWLEGFLYKKLIKYVVDNCGIKRDVKSASELNKKDIISLVYFLKNMKIAISGTKGLESSEVSAGGVNVSQVEPKSMESKLQKGLYFVGEVLDVDGKCGGYNLHWAWASGYVCANSIIKGN
jgi:predicted Rossmann fold flavoprotein